MIRWNSGADSIVWMKEDYIIRHLFIFVSFDENISICNVTALELLFRSFLCLLGVKCFP